MSLVAGDGAVILRRQDDRKTPQRFAGSANFLSESESESEWERERGGREKLK
jgi:hypothetical protein